MSDTQAADVDFSGYAEVVGPAWVLVPEEPTPEMLEAGEEAAWDHANAMPAIRAHAAAYAAMLAAAPPPPAGSDGWRERADDIRRSIIRQLGDDPHADRIILPGTDWDVILGALAPTPPVAPRG